MQHTQSTILQLVVLLSLAISPLRVLGQNTWSFVSAPDWHLGKYELHPPLKAGVLELQRNTLQDMKRHNPELLLIDGDLVSGPWVGQEWIDRFAPGGSQEEAIINVCKVAYGNLKQRFEENGFNNILVAIGDHEIGEDSNWKPGNEISHLLPVYRDAFQRIWNRDKQGHFKYSQSIGSAESRPIGTPWENTSFAYKHRNVLFVTIDIFDQPDPDKPVGYLKRSIHANMPSDHLRWFEKVLKEARKDPEINHIVVQAHSPVLAPVRGQYTSMLYTEHEKDSPFWKLMQAYQVDLFFAGEVHAPSAQRINDTFPIQVVHGAPFGRNYLAVKVSEHRLHLILRELNEKKFSCIGEMTIDKSSRTPTVDDLGMLAIINTQQALLHYTFDEQTPLPYNVPAGSGFIQHFLANEKQMEISNVAQMGRYYNLYTDALLSDGIRGNAIHMNGSETVVCQGRGVMTRNNPLTFIAWVKSGQKDAACLSSHGNGMGNFDICLRDGRLVVFVANSSIQATESGTIINDGKWHQVAVVFPEGGKTLQDVKLYMDAIHHKNRLAGADCAVMVRPTYKMRVGTSSRNKRLGLKHFIGSMDEMSIWYRPLSDDEILADYKSVKRQARE